MANQHQPLLLVAEEYAGGGDSGGDVGRRTLSIVRDSGGNLVHVSHEAGQAWSWFLFLRAAFLPEGFPSSVTPDYLPFQVWDTLQGLSSYIRGMLSTQALLAGLGVGVSGASAISAAYQWFLRDAAAMLAGIAFTLLQGSNLDSRAKQWRLAADCLNDFGMAVELAAPIVPALFLPLACIGSIARAITGVAGGATRVALTQHFALKQNAADISAKEGSQETVATLLGMLLGMLLVKLTAGRAMLMWTSFITLTAFHVFANYRAMRCLHLTSLNRERTAILLRQYRDLKTVLRPAAVAAMESVLPGRSDPSLRRIKLGCRLAACKATSMSELQKLREQCMRDRYAVYPAGDNVLVVLDKRADSDDILRGFISAFMLLERPGKEWMNLDCQEYLRKIAENGWEIRRTLLEAGSHCVVWGDNPFEINNAIRATKTQHIMFG